MQPPVRLVLASGSPRRRVLLRRAGYRFTVVRSDVAELHVPGEPAEDMVTRLAAAKATAVAVHHPGALVLGADTEVTVDGLPMSKPRDEEHAVEMLIRLGGTSHQVMTAFALASGSRVLDQAVDHTTVEFGPVDEASARAYAATGEPLDRAGAYAIQGLGRRFVSRIHGSFTNVMGLPMEALEPALSRHGVLPDPAS